LQQTVTTSAVPAPAAPAAEAATVDGRSLYADQILPQGKSFQGLQRLLILTPDRLVAQCSLPKLEVSMQGQFLSRRFNPYTADLLVQSIQVWAKSQQQPTSLPLEMDQITSFAAIPFDHSFYIALERLATGAMTVTAYDDAGQVYVQMVGVRLVSEQGGRSRSGSTPILANHYQI
jgi:Polyketide synthase dehydratase